MVAANASKLLALETSSEWCSAALWLEGEVLVDEVVAGQTHSELLLPMVDGLLSKAGLDLGRLNAIAFGSGPGSFTGMRIACGVAQGLAFAAELPVVAVTSLLALAEASGGEHVIACLDARMAEIYFAAYRRNNKTWACVHEPVLCRPAASPMIEGSGWIGAGSGFAAYGPVLAARYEGHLRSQRADLHPSAREVAILGARRLALGLTVRAEDAVPLYLRDRVALTTEERQRERAGAVRPA
ncbi:MAG: tRNA (adenosine(37)-N6)-threonylcarbamoyltransferase complex dimerization subunit type 1 TsaB [Proteobacteria bacterium]|nr:MAG: tRNA (adenosine(37)-N6)-threonylcarbamoyltransferase complex dimerization subunit type 1 TsaB [Pseudomonadota bacterium]